LGSSEKSILKTIDDAGFANFSLGPKITYRGHRFSPFIEVLVGGHRLMPETFHDVTKLGFMFGGGLDINLSRQVALRLLRADYVLSDYRFGASLSRRTLQSVVQGCKLASISCSVAERLQQLPAPLARYSRPKSLRASP